DLRRFLADEPIVARPVPAWERLRKWARRRPLIAGLTAVAVALAASLLGLGAYSYAEINRSLGKARSEEQKALGQTKLALQRADALAEQDYINRVSRAYREILDDNIELAEDLLHGCPPGRRGWEWHFVKRLAHLDRLTLEGGSRSVEGLAYGPDG